jgi:hypothetical protein
MALRLMSDIGFLVTEDCSESVFILRPALSVVALVRRAKIRLKGVI